MKTLQIVPIRIIFRLINRKKNHSLKTPIKKITRKKKNKKLIKMLKQLNT